MEPITKAKGLKRARRAHGRGLAVLASGAALFGAGTAAHAQLIIQPQFGASITSDPAAAAIEAAINADIANTEHDFTNKMTVQITYNEMSSGLGESSSEEEFVNYSTFRSALAAEPANVNRATALASLPNTSGNPVNSNSQIVLTVANAVALGIDPSDNNTNVGSISLNTSSCNLTRTSIDPSKYDLQAVAQHETDEVLGIGGAGSQLNSVIDGGSLSSPVGAMDLYRYSANGVRSYTTSTTATAYFSINGGATNIVGFNQNGATDGSDMGDWAASSPVLVQDAYGTPGVIVNLANPELTAFDVVGYNPAATTPAPDTLTVVATCLFMSGCPAWIRKARGRRRRHASEG